MAHLLFRIGRGSAARPFIAIVAWLVALAASVGGFFAFGGTLTDSFTIPGLETERVADQLAEEIPGADGGNARVVFQTEDGSALTEAQQAQISAALVASTDIDSVTGVIDPFETEATREQAAAQLAAGSEQIDAARDEIEAAQAQIDAGQEQLDAGQAELDAGLAELEAGQAELDAQAEQARAAGLYDQYAEQFATQQATIDAGRAQLEAGQAELDAAQAELTAGQDELDAGADELELQASQLDLGAQVGQNAAAISSVSEDGSTALGIVQFETGLFAVDQIDKNAVIDAVSSQPLDGVQVDFSADIATDVSGVLGIGEVIGVALAFLVLALMMRSFFPAVQPIITSLLGVGVGVTTALAFSGVVEMSSVTPILGVMLGLAVGIDYSLFIVNRHRLQRRRGMDLYESIGLANGTSGNAVVFAGTTVLVALLALNITGVPFLGIMGTVAAFCVGIAVLTSVTLTPALLGLMGDRVLSRQARASIGAAEHAEAPVSPMRTGRALLSLLVASAVLLVLAIPSASMRLGLPDGTQEPQDSTQYIAYTTIGDKFGEGFNGTLLVTADLPVAVAEGQELAVQAAVGNELMTHDDVVAVAPIGVSEDRDYFAFQVIPAEGPSSESTEQLVRDLRDSSPVSSENALIDGTEIGVAGEASGNIDVSQKLDAVLPLYLAIVVGLSLIILIVVFRSIWVPVIATLGFVLSLFAAFGLLTAVFQWGWLGGLFGVHDPGPVLSFLPILLTGILFGLAMDYQLFLTTGMREAYVHGASARTSVVAGLRHGRAVVTAAAIIMASVFGGFMFSHIAMIRPMGFGLALGVLLDAFVVRMVIVPSIMHLMGDKAWWLPAWLDKILPNVDVEGAALEREHPLVVEAADEAAEAKG